MVEKFGTGKEAVTENGQKKTAGKRIIGLVSAVQSFLLHLTFSWQYLLMALLKTPMLIDDLATTILKDKQGKN